MDQHSVLDSFDQAKRAARRVSEFIFSSFWGDTSPTPLALQLYRKGRACLHEKLYSDAIENFYAALSSPGGLSEDIQCDTHFLLGRCLLHTNQVSTSLKHFDIASRAIRDSTSYELQYDIHLYRSQAAQLLSDLSQASAHLQLAADVAKRKGDRDRLCEALMKKSAIEIQRGDLEEARRAIESLLKHFPEHTEAKLVRIEISMQLLKYEEVFQLLGEICDGKEEAEMTEKQLGKVYSIKGTAEFRTNKFEQCVQSLNKALEFDGSLQDALRLRGIAFLKLDEFRKGLHDLTSDPCLDGKMQILEKIICIPDEYRCPVTYEVMHDPVVAHDGFSYERKVIEEWFSMKDTSPMTNKVLPDKTLRPNLMLRNAINDLRERAPSLFEPKQTQTVTLN